MTNIETCVRRVEDLALELDNARLDLTYEYLTSLLRVLNTRISVDGREEFVWIYIRDLAENVIEMMDGLDQHGIVATDVDELNNVYKYLKQLSNVLSSTDWVECDDALRLIMSLKE